MDGGSENRIVYMTSDMIRLYTVKDTAKILGVSVNKVYELIQNGELKAFDLGRWKIKGEEINRYIDSLPEIRPEEAVIENK